MIFSIFFSSSCRFLADTRKIFQIHSIDTLNSIKIFFHPQNLTEFEGRIEWKMIELLKWIYSRESREKWHSIDSWSAPLVTDFSIGIYAAFDEQRMVKRSRKKAFSSCKESCHECTKISTFIIKTQSFVKSFTFFSTTLYSILQKSPHIAFSSLLLGKGWIVCQNHIIWNFNKPKHAEPTTTRMRVEEQKRHENSIFRYTHERRENWYFLSTSDHTAVLRMTASLWQLECVYQGGNLKEKHQ